MLLDALRGRRGQRRPRANSRALPRARLPRPARRARRSRRWLDPDTVASETSYEAALLAAGLAIEAVERGGFALVRPPGHHALPEPGDGLLPLRQRRRRRPLRAGGARARARRDRRLGRPPRQRHAGDLLGRPVRALRLAPPVAVLPGHRRARRARTRRRSTCRSRPAPATRSYLRAFDERGRAGGARVRARTCCSSRPASTRTSTTRSPRCASPPTASASSPAARPRSRRASPPCSRAATTSRTLPALVAAALEGFAGMTNGRPEGRPSLPRKHSATALPALKELVPISVSARGPPGVLGESHPPRWGIRRGTKRPGRWRARRAPRGARRRRACAAGSSRASGRCARR